MRVERWFRFYKQRMGRQQRGEELKRARPSPQLQSSPRAYIFMLSHLPTFASGHTRSARTFFVTGQAS